MSPNYNDITWLPVNTSAEQWSVPMSGAQYDNQTICSHSRVAYFDSGSSYLAVPTEDLVVLIERMTNEYNWEVDADTGLLYRACSSRLDFKNI